MLSLVEGQPGSLSLHGKLNRKLGAFFNFPQRLSEDPSIRVAVLEAGLDNSTDPAVSVVGK
jgi:hypothetical protein